MRARRDHRGDYNCHGFGEIFGNFRLAICMQPHLIRLARSEGSRQGSCVCLPCERDTREIVSRYDHYDKRAFVVASCRPVLDLRRYKSITESFN